MEPTLRGDVERRRRSNMKAILAALIITGGAGIAQPALAKGCLKGAAIGGVAGHLAGGHGVLGAAAGCLIGRHEAKKRDRQRLEQRENRDSNGNYEAPRI
jgi:hypothetical protein